MAIFWPILNHWTELISDKKCEMKVKALKNASVFKKSGVFYNLIEFNVIFWKVEKQIGQYGVCLDSVRSSKRANFVLSKM